MDKFLNSLRGYEVDGKYYLINAEIETVADLYMKFKSSGEYDFQEFVRKNGCFCDEYEPFTLFAK